MTLAAVVGPVLLVTGLSLLLYANQYVKLLKKWKDDHFVLVWAAFFSLVLGLIIVQMHNVWEANLWVVITIIGWLAIIKGLFYFLAPESCIKGFIKYFENSGWFYFSGLVCGILGAVMSYYVYVA